jgi:NAD+ synthase (glutamine-hydrolysing)
MESAKNICGYVYASSGVHESTTDLVFGGHNLLAENGNLLSESALFERESNITYGDLDFEMIKFERTYGQNFEESTSAYCSRIDITRVPLAPIRLLDSVKDKLIRKYQRNPFIPSDPSKVDQRCREIFNIQAAGLAKRMEHTHSKKAVVGISGGLDSTLALLVCAETFKLIGKESKDIIAVTMPGFGTTGKTYNNAQTIMKLLGADVREIPIRDAVLQHFKDISHDPSQHDVTYENSQARERTQILMDVANQEGGLVVGTGDLSEVALGWSTYNGDHMSMYGVNTSVPKTLVRFVIKWVMDHRLSGPGEEKGYSLDNELLRKTLQDIMDTPISPELLPPDESGEIAQKTEDTVGPYILHDFFMFYTIRFGMSPKKLLFIAKSTFAGEYSEEFIKKWLTVFYRRFFSQQFKRSCIPDGPKVGSVSLSPRGDWRMPSDADPAVWLKELED